MGLLEWLEKIRELENKINEQGERIKKLENQADGVSTYIDITESEQ